MHIKSLCLAAAAVFTVGLSAGARADVTATAPMTFTSPDVPVAICDLCTVRSTLRVAEHGRVLDIDALVDITHGWDADLVLSLSHGATTVLLANRQGGSGGANYTGTVFDDGAPIAIDAGYAYAPYTGAFRPQEALAAFIGQDVFGDWTLTVTDSEAGDAGTIDHWGIAATVPEPASLALFAAAALGLAGARRRRRANL